ncbi:MAG: peptidylprolyl isomerase [Planctomycetes bacterium]|nr:peptidylprolyl isomerase [Planctomycetota bacterium]
MQIIKNAIASIHYTLKNDEGVILDTSEGRDPLSFHYGVGQIIPGLEAALEGKAAGESISVRIEAKDGYGEKNEEMIQTIPREHMPEGAELQVGMQLQAQTPDGQAQVVTIVGLTNTDVTLDGNHPLAGVALNFAVEVVEVRKATEEELASVPGGAGESAEEDS